jgi:CHAT domain-containing protein
VALRRRPAVGRRPRRTLAVLADPTFDERDRDRLPPLPFSRAEAERIAALAPPGEVLVALGSRASRDLVAGGALAGYRFVHFATHARLDAEHPELSGLELAAVDARGRRRDGGLRLLDVYGLALEADLVTLSACRTALGREVRGEGLVGLTRGFLHAGARAVLVSLWQVPDEAAAVWMERFYAALLGDGLSPAAAARRTRAALWAEPRWAAPAYWAAFELQGDAW